MRSLKSGPELPAGKAILSLCMRFVAPSSWSTNGTLPTKKVLTLPKWEALSMRRAFILINTNLGTETALQSELKKVEGIVGVYQVYGVYDMVVVVEAESEEQLKDIVFSRIRTLKYLRSTLTLNVVS
jgi:DNA-binding Lrp family transcriptional regulator